MLRRINIYQTLIIPNLARHYLSDGGLQLHTPMLKESNYIKIRVSVPVEAAGKVRQAMGRAGAGIQGNYNYCSGSIKQIGRFKPIAGAHPAIGEIGKLEEVEEELIETICRKDLAEKVAAEIKKAHPYEEPAIDIMPRYDIV